MPPTICEMPSAKQVWQGTSIHWRGYIYSAKHAHGSFTDFVDLTCGRGVRIRDGIPTEVALGKRYASSVFSVAAEYEVQGNIAYYENSIVLDLVSAKRLTKLLGDGEFEAMARERAAQMAR